MPEPFIDPSDPVALLKEFDDDDRHVKEDFKKHLNAEFGELALSLAKAWKAELKLDAVANCAMDMQSAITAVIMHGVLDDILLSAKLFMSGKPIPSGHMMRQAAEGLSFAIMCASSKPLLMLEKKVGKQKAKWIQVTYWRLFEKSDDRIQGHLAYNQLKQNQTALGLTVRSLAQFKCMKDHFNRMSHSGLLALAFKQNRSSEAQAYTGGNFDMAKLEAYKTELGIRIGFINVLPEFIEHIAVQLADRPAGTLQPPVSG
jgi:hypothetical protein